MEVLCEEILGKTTAVFEVPLELISCMGESHNIH